MAEWLTLHPENPQPRLVSQVAQAIDQGAVIAYPTDSSYALGCRLDDKPALERIRRIRQTDRHHNMTLICRDLSDIALYARVDNRQFRLLKSATPGPFTFILQASREVPRRLQHPRRRTIGIRIPDHALVQALLAQRHDPLLSCTLTLPDQEGPLLMADDIFEQLKHDVDMVLDVGYCPSEPTTVLDLSHGLPPQLVRQGIGDASAYL